MEQRRSSPARFLGPLALIAAAIALVLVIGTSGGGGGGDPASSTGADEKARDLGERASERRERREERREEREDAETEDVYVVEEGDTLGGIAEKTGVPVERLEELNPGLDQFQLVAGQRIKLR